MTTIENEPTTTESGTAAPTGGRRFPDPYEVAAPAGAENWRDMYSYFNLFLEERREKDDKRTWFRNGMQFPEPMPPFDIATADSAYMSVGVMNTRVFALPPALGMDIRVVNGHMYMSALGVDDPAELERRAAEFGPRVGHYYANWPDLYARWEDKVRAQIAALQQLELPALGDFEPQESVLAGRGVTEANDLLVAFQAILASLDATWNLHSEMLNMGYAAYLNFLMTVKSHFPEIKDQQVAQMVSGVDVLLFRPDDELKRLAAKAIELGVADRVVGVTDLGALTQDLSSDEAGRQWLAEWEVSADPWFNFSYGNGFYHHHRSWNDDPTFPLGMVGEYVGRLRNGEDLSRPVAEVEAERDAVTARYRELIPEGEARQAFDDALGLSKTVFPYVENHNFYIEHWYMTVFWNKMRELGEVFVRFGFFDQVDDMFFLRRAELADAVADVQISWCSGGEPIGPSYWPKIVAERRRMLDVLRAELPPPALGPAPGAIVEPMTIMLWGITDEQVQKWLAAEDDAKVLEGFAGSPGVVEGRARVVMSPQGLDDLLQDEILVAPITSPSWTPVFARIKGAVSDIGGIMCHAAIVSREYGLPAVVGTGNATSAIRTGDLIRVDGDTGTVTILDA
ncbi:PEP-utilizing enzyme [Nocardioides sp. CFH 31398]|uniref:PEP-utilizing enzyme n=1 Tax=Nocardioides sp. CFH 31398 TaxID=2919579 RepID=UPI001F06C432|nr:PEP-utilizing enzyme [Nocardioides sp. CFH 31398]MCH1865503.1 PEP-utilizing enzyme [Nocardioides sp. CFH 31398]